MSGIGDISVPGQLKQVIAMQLDELAKSLNGYFPIRELYLAWNVIYDVATAAALDLRAIRHRDSGEGVKEPAMGIRRQLEALQRQAERRTMLLEHLLAWSGLAPVSTSQTAMRIRHLAKGHYGIEMGKTGDQTADLPVGGRPLYHSATASPVYSSTCDLLTAAPNPSAPSDGHSIPWAQGTTRTEDGEAPAG
ncbi:unnamed protein product [Pleuronectes platessa]|uniref:Uncharacterized protein n=1 Tax=Pleuronectes platessa TaxID=8262 RepID=A0A9N7UBI4_PLEPL|nr:unnamed protein product [Pleuronectes platessa]